MRLANLLQMARKPKCTLTRIMFRTEKRRRLPYGVSYNVLVALEDDLCDLATR